MNNFCPVLSDTNTYLNRQDEQIDWDEAIQDRIRESIDDHKIKTVVREWLVGDLVGGNGDASKQLEQIILELLSAAQNNPLVPVVINPQQFSAFAPFIDEIVERYTENETPRKVIVSEIKEERY